MSVETSDEYITSPEGSGPITATFFGHEKETAPGQHLQARSSQESNRVFIRNIMLAVFLTVGALIIGLIIILYRWRQKVAKEIAKKKKGHKKRASSGSVVPLRMQGPNNETVDRNPSPASTSSSIELPRLVVAPNTPGLVEQGHSPGLPLPRGLRHRESRGLGRGSGQPAVGAPVEDGHVRFNPYDHQQQDPGTGVQAQPDRVNEDDQITGRSQYGQQPQELPAEAVRQSGHQGRRQASQVSFPFWVHVPLQGRAPSAPATSRAPSHQRGGIPVVGHRAPPSALPQTRTQQPGPSNRRRRSHHRRHSSATPATPLGVVPVRRQSLPQRRREVDSSRPSHRRRHSTTTSASSMTALPQRHHSQRKPPGRENSGQRPRDRATSAHGSGRNARHRRTASDQTHAASRGDVTVDINNVANGGNVNEGRRGRRLSWTMERFLDDGAGDIVQEHSRSRRRNSRRLRRGRGGPQWMSGAL